MIGDAVLDVVFGGLSAIVSVLPDNTLDLAGLGAGAEYIGWVGLVFNMPVLVGVMATIGSIELLLVGFRFALFVWRLTPFS